MDWVALGSFLGMVVFGAGIWVTSVRTNKEDIRNLKEEVKEVKAHNARQDALLVDLKSDNKIILLNLEYIRLGLDELRQEHKEQTGCALKATRELGK